MNKKLQRHIVIRDAQQNNLKNLNLKLPLNKLIVVTGPSGAGKSSLALDTIYAEGQRRFIQSFSPYARQFLERIDRPAVKYLGGIPPAIAIGLANPVRTSRSTVGTMTELADYFKLLFAKASSLYCPSCQQPVRSENPREIRDIVKKATSEISDPIIVIYFEINIPKNFEENEIRRFLSVQGYTRIRKRSNHSLSVIQDRFKLRSVDELRFVEAIEAAQKIGKGRVTIHVLNERKDLIKEFQFSQQLHCASCDLSFRSLTPSAFSFNSPLGACDVCRGFGRVIGVDFDLVVPDKSKTLAAGAIKPWQTKSFKECQNDLEDFANRAGIPLDVAWNKLQNKDRNWVLYGEKDWINWKESWPGKWYGVSRFFEWLETKSYKMHIRVLLSKYRSYTQCNTCNGSRLKREALNWRIAKHDQCSSNSVPDPSKKNLGDQVGGLNIHDVMTLPITRLSEFVNSIQFKKDTYEALKLVMIEIKRRVSFLDDVGLGYITLDRQARTLSGGEIQRVNLTTALGSSLTNTLFVLDEPTSGLHNRDVEKIITIMKKLIVGGNSILVVENDPQVVMEADYIFDLGPGAGRNGGSLVYDGKPKDFLPSQTKSETAAYLNRDKEILAPAWKKTKLKRKNIEISGIKINNLDDLNVRIPLNSLVAITGVSGSGKSTLMISALYKASLDFFSKGPSDIKYYKKLSGLEELSEVLAIDQKPIGKSARSNPISYVGGFDEIRKIFGKTLQSKYAGYQAGDFSFNGGSGRCSVCNGTGFEHVEMQFLSDVYLECAACKGKRYKKDILSIRLDFPGKARLNITEVLDLTVEEAIKYFDKNKALRKKLQTLASVGLEYLSLGQPVPTLSGGEAQRLKLAAHLVKIKAERPTLFLLDEPTTGLHFRDIAILVSTLHRLVDEGHSVIVIEHNLDVIRASDWVIEMGPEGGHKGGRIVFSGRPKELTLNGSTATGFALSKNDREIQLPDKTPKILNNGARDGSINIINARENNLKNISLTIPHDKLTVITGISGSGKSTLAFDIIFGEGQRRFLESINAYARQFVQSPPRPEIDAIYGIPPTVAIEQRVSQGGVKSTVATQTEIYHYLRLLFVKLGEQYCPKCKTKIESTSSENIIEKILYQFNGQRAGILAPLVQNRKGTYAELAEWALRKGFTHLRVDDAFVATADFPSIDRHVEHSIDLPVADIFITQDNIEILREQVEKALHYGKGTFYFIAPIDNFKKDNQYTNQIVFSTKRSCSNCGQGYDSLDPRLFSFNSKYGWCEVCLGKGVVENKSKQHKEEICGVCNGGRLNPTARAVKFRNLAIADFVSFTVLGLHQFFSKLRFSPREKVIASEIKKEIQSRLNFLIEVGLPYLKLNRSAPSLSGGEAQRIRLAAQLGSDLNGVCYVLDEPTIGLHPTDNRILLNALKKLQRAGNTLVVVEHDRDLIEEADHIVDLGPGAGTLGGNVTASGSLAKIKKSRNSLTGKFLSSPLHRSLKNNVNSINPHNSIQIINAKSNNLKMLNVYFPLNALTVVTGVSGSGKSTLVKNVLSTNLSRLINRGSAGKKPVKLTGCERLVNFEKVNRVLEVDQSPIGKTPRSCPATYVGIWNIIRDIFSSTEIARLRGFSSSRFSFNKKEGSCSSCNGQGYRRIEMNFLSDVKVLCGDCGGMRFNPDTLAIKFRDISIGQVLDMTIEKAAHFFSSNHILHKTLRLMVEVGLGYLRLGQPCHTLSGGEAQRIKLVSELAKMTTKVHFDRDRNALTTVYILDEPTVGLHMADVEKLIQVLNKLVSAGNTVVVIEHNLDIWAEADWIIDLGPEGGDAGGEILFMGHPSEIIHNSKSYTGRELRKFLMRGKNNSSGNSKIKSNKQNENKKNHKND